MNLLLDTHVWIWSQEKRGKLGPTSTETLTNAETRLYVSTVSTLEIARLIAVRTIELTGPLDSWVKGSLDSLLCSTIEISHEIAGAAYELPQGLHRDPADRILVATARLNDFTLVTADQRILDYRHVRTLDART